MKIFIRILASLYLLPGMFIDLCFGAAFIMSDGRSDNHNGDWLGVWLCDILNQLPQWLSISLMPSVFICALPAGAICIGIVLGTIIGIVWAMMNLGAAILNMPFSGKFEWGLFDK